MSCRRSFCISSSQRRAEASLGMRQSPRGESATLPILGPSGMAERLNWLAHAQEGGDFFFKTAMVAAAAVSQSRTGCATAPLVECFLASFNDLGMGAEPEVVIAGEQYHFLSSTGGFAQVIHNIFIACGKATRTGK